MEFESTFEKIDSCMVENRVCMKAKNGYTLRGQKREKFSKKKIEIKKLKNENSEMGEKNKKETFYVLV